MFLSRLVALAVLTLALAATPADAWDPVKDITGKPLHEHGEKLAREVGNGVRDVAREAERLGRKTLEEIGNAGEDLRVLIEEGKCGGDLCDALNAAVKMVEANVVDLGVTAESAAERIREGKIIDALWHMAVDPINDQQENAAQAVLESSVLRAIGQVAAGAYGGPKGAAAYAAWLTYNATDGDIEASLKAAAITGATAAAMGKISKVEGIDVIKGVEIDAITQRAALSGAIAGVAVAAAGGDEQAVKNAISAGFTMGLIREGYKELTTTRLEDNLKASTGEPYCLAADPQINLPDAERLSCLPPKDAYFRDKDGNVATRGGKPQVDVTKLDAARPHVGLFAESVENAGFFREAAREGANGVVVSGKAFSESTGFMQAVSKIPGMNAMAVGHDIADASWNKLADIPVASDAFLVVEYAVRVGSIAPSVVLTYEGAGYRVHEMIRDAAQSRASGGASSGDASSAAASAPVASGSEAEAFAQMIHPDAPAFEVRNLVCLGNERPTTALLESKLDSLRLNQGDRICVLRQATTLGWVDLWHAHHDAGSCARAFNRLATRALSRGERCFISTGLRYGASYAAAEMESAR